MLDCWMDGRLRLSHPQNKTEGRDELLEVVSRGTMGWTDRDRTDYVEHVSLRPVWLETVLGRVGSQSGRFGALHRRRRGVYCCVGSIFAERIMGPLKGMHFPTFLPPSE